MDGMVRMSEYDCPACGKKYHRPWDGKPAHCRACDTVLVAKTLPPEEKPKSASN